MLKNTLDKAAFDSLPDVLKGEYVASGDTYILQHDEDTGALKRALAREKQRAEKVEETLSTVEGERDTLKRDAARQGTPAQIAAAAKEEALKEVQPQIERGSRLAERLTTSELSKTAGDLAMKIGGDKNKVALLPHIERRLEVTLGDDDTPTLVVKDAAGKPTTLKVEDLEKEVRADKNLASLVLVSAASGGIGRVPQQGKQSPASGASEKRLSQMTSAERQQHIALLRETQQSQAS